MMKRLHRVFSGIIIAWAVLAVVSSPAPAQGERIPLPEHDFVCSAPFPDAAKLPPAAQQQLGITMETAGAVRNLLSSQGRKDFQDNYEKGGTEAALRHVRERAALYAMTCGLGTTNYRSGVCQNFQLMCLAHGGGGCDMCVRAWAAEECTDLLNATADAPIEEVRKNTGYDEEWKEIMSVAGKLDDDPTLLDHLENAQSRFINDPIHANCHALF